MTTRPLIRGGASGGGIPAMPSKPSGMIVLPAYGGEGVTANATFSFSQFYAFPIYLSAQEIDAFHVFVGTTAAVNVHFSLYEDNGSGLGAEVLDIGLISTASSGDQSVTGLGFTPTAGWYWIGFTTSGNASLSAWSDGVSTFGFTHTVNTTDLGGVRITSGYTVHPTDLTGITNFISQSGCPRMGFKLA